jgi:hypothetical protein
MHYVKWPQRGGALLTRRHGPRCEEGSSNMSAAPVKRAPYIGSALAAEKISHE